MHDLVPGRESGAVALNAAASASERAYLFRADDYYYAGPVGLPLGDDANAADIQDFAEHVLRKESNRTSRYTSFSEEIKVARRFTADPDSRSLRKVGVAALDELATAGVIKIWNPDSVYVALKAGPRKLSRQAADVCAAMLKSHEILVEGCIPENLMSSVN